ncbi:MAG: hypothetical protein K0M69_06805 [Youngiibacter sp.]|nr:hypothetical protein [Youngiibacter sp.]
MGTVILKMTEKQFWNSTPRKLHGLFKIHKAVNGIDDDRVDTIDNIPL